MHTMLKIILKYRKMILCKNILIKVGIKMVNKFYLILQEKFTSFN